jgi:hypothetical protein
MDVDSHVSSTTASSPARTDETGPLQLQLVNWPLRDQPRRSIVMILLLALVSILTGQASESLSMGLLAGSAALVASWRYWLPVTYEIGPYGIRQLVFKRVRRLSWRQVGRIEIRNQGIRFLPDHDPAQLANLRGLYIYHPGQEETLKHVVNYYMQSLEMAGSSSRPTAH